MFSFHSEDKEFVCTIPYLEYRQENAEKSHTDDSSSVSLITPFLKPLRDNCIYRWEGWWTYEFCYGKHIRQFHQEQDGKVSTQYYLGYDTYDKNSPTVDFGVKNTDHYAEEYNEGTTCDLNNQQRAAQVRFYCDATLELSILSSVKEPSSCKYTIEIKTPYICSHPSFTKFAATQEAAKSEKILCFESPLPEVIIEEPSHPQRIPGMPNLDGSIELMPESLSGISFATNKQTNQIYHENQHSNIETSLHGIIDSNIDEPQEGTATPPPTATPTSSASSASYHSTTGSVPSIEEKLKQVFDQLGLSDVEAKRAKVHFKPVERRFEVDEGEDNGDDDEENNQYKQKVEL
eukprot:TRINITY_DN2864_c0_g1_i1.p1 TRINITY_DN2864_c0_g1~~TRINITY_DN2864_c0_g1_i1.p1  ORF type:complete len:347 (+),score=87.02 TRINITY_DN2864_c0_g1_i1:1229-2269(+)